MSVPIEYIPGFVADPQDVFNRLWTELAWVNRDNAPRLEYYCNDFPVPYTYGRGAGQRTYEPMPYHPLILDIRTNLEALTGTKFEVCFLNGYRDGSDQLGWHADDSPEMDDERPIAIVSLGARREIYFKLQPKPEVTTSLEEIASQKKNLNIILAPTNEVSVLWLDSGSLCLMLPGMQDTHFHRIPKSSVMNCGPRVSLTFRGYVKGTL